MAAQVNGPEGIPPDQPFKLNAETGCWHGISDAVTFSSKFRAGAYIGIQMVTVGSDGFPMLDQQEQTPLIDAPSMEGPAGQFWFGPLPETKVYQIMQEPRAAWGTPMVITVCGRTSPPK